ncbi:MAG: S-adenosylmethionine decarboxylase, partial [Acidobacteriota bacterium]
MSTLPVLGQHLILDLFGCPPSPPVVLREVLHAVAAAAALEVVGEVEHHYTPHGYTAVLLLAESHLALHTWPEH